MNVIIPSVGRIMPRNGWSLFFVPLAVFLVIGIIGGVSYSAHLLVLFAFYILLAESLDLVVGRAGLLVFCQAALCGCGAYAFALARIRPEDLTVSMPDVMWSGGWPYVLALILGILAGGIAGAFVGWMLQRVRGDTLIFASLGMQMVFHELMYNSPVIGNGATGLHGIARPTFNNAASDTPEGFALLAAPIALVAVLLVRRLRDSGFGLVLECIHDDEIAVQSVGVDTARITVSVVAIAGVGCGLAGALFAGYMRFVEPGSFSIDLGIAVFAALLLSVPGSRHASVMCAGILVGLPELLRLIGFPTSQAASLRGVVYGIVLISLALRSNSCTAPSLKART